MVGERQADMEFELPNSRKVRILERVLETIDDHNERIASLVAKRFAAQFYTL